MKNVKNWVIFALMAILSLGMSSCSTDSDNKLEAYKKVDEKTFKENIEASKRNGTPQIIDYRSA